MPLIIKTNIKEYLTLLNMTINDLIQETGISKNAISNILTGKNNPSLESLYYISDIFNCSMSDLLDKNKVDLQLKQEAEGLYMLTDDEFYNIYSLPKIANTTQI